MGSCTTIDEVIAALDAIIHQSVADESPLGYFAVLYRKVTIRVKNGILQNEFEDNRRMEKLDVLFANRYLDAYHSWQTSGTCSRSWMETFTASRRSGHIVLQHLLAGINAHINLDLGIAVVDTVGNAPLESSRADFDAINRILMELLDEVKQNIAAVSPVFKWLMPLAKNADEKFIQFSIQVARDGAWTFAEQLYSNKINRTGCIAERDQTIATLATALLNPRGRLAWILKLIYWAEYKSVSQKISALSRGL
jgi:hypothetical protein